MLAYLAGNSGAPYDGRFWHDAAASLWRVVCGYILAVIPGLILGLWSCRSATISRLLSSYINDIKLVPGISCLSLALSLGARTGAETEAFTS